MKTSIKMAKNAWVAFAALLFLNITSAHAGKVMVEESVSLNVKPAAVWALVGDYNGLYRWHPAVAKSETDNKVRILTLGNGATITETLLAQKELAYSYRIDESPLPVENYEANIMIKSNGKGGSVVTWNSTFEAKGATDQEAADAIRGVYKAGLGNLAELYN